MAYEYNAGGTVVTDETIGITEAVTLSGNALYMGRVRGLAAQSVLDSTQTTYGVWAGASKAGQRYTVISSGIPGSTIEVLWDLQSGRVYRSVSSTLYTRYLKYADLNNEGRIYQISIPFSLVGTVSDIYVDISPWKIRFGEYMIAIDGNRPTGTLNLAVRTGTGGAGSYATITLASTESRYSATFKALGTSGLEFGYNTPLVIRGAGSNYSNIKVTLREKMEQS